MTKNSLLCLGPQSVAGSLNKPSSPSLPFLRARKGYNYLQYCDLCSPRGYNNTHPKVKLPPGPLARWRKTHPLSAKFHCKIPTISLLCPPSKNPHGIRTNTDPQLGRQYERRHSPKLPSHRYPRCIQWLGISNPFDGNNQRNQQVGRW